MLLYGVMTLSPQLNLLREMLYHKHERDFGLTDPMANPNPGADFAANLLAFSRWLGSVIQEVLKDQQVTQLPESIAEYSSDRFREQLGRVLVDYPDSVS